MSKPQCATSPATSAALRIGYVLRMYPRFSQTFVVNEILELERQGVEVHIASLKKPTDGRFQESLSRVRAEVDYIPEWWMESITKTIRAHWSEVSARPAGYFRAIAAALRHRGASLTDLRQAALVLRWARKRRLGHVHVHFGTNEASVAYLAHLMGGLSYSLTLHAFDIFRDNVDRVLLARKINASRFTVTVSEYNRAFMVRELPGVRAEKILVNYNGIDLESFSPTGAARTPLTIATVGRLIEKKGFIHLVRAVGALRDGGLPVRCTIVGDGPQEELLKSEIKRLKLRDSVTLAGALSQDQVRDLLSRSACFALPCVQAADGNVDALPTVLLEAMGCGCPCVSTQLSGVPEILEDGRSGLLAPAGDEGALAKALRRVLESTELARGLADEGRRRAEALFDVRRNVARMRGWFYDAVSSPLMTPSEESPIREDSRCGEIAVAGECRI